MGRTSIPRCVARGFRAPTEELYFRFVDVNVNFGNDALSAESSNF